MFNTLKKRIKNEKGLSLVELLAVIVILAIVAAIAIPAIGNIIDSSRVKGMKADIANVISAANIYKTDMGSLPANTTVTKLKEAGFLETPGTVAGTTTITYTNNEIVLGGTAVVNSKTYTLTGVKLSTLKVDSKDLTDTGISPPTN